MTPETTPPAGQPADAAPSSRIQAAGKSQTGCCHKLKPDVQLHQVITWKPRPAFTSKRLVPQTPGVFILLGLL
jgi:hypothetical protein